MMFKMLSKIMSRSLIYLVILLAMGSMVFAAECVGTLSAPTKLVFPGEEFTVSFFNAEPTSTGLDVNLNLPVGLTTVSTNPQAGNPFNVHKWTITAASAQIYDASVTVDGLCEKNFSVNVVDTVDNPNLDITVDAIPDIMLGDSAPVTVTIENLGTGIATDVSGLLSTAGNANLEANTISHTQIEVAPATVSTDHILTPTYCTGNSFTDTLTVNLNNFKNANGKFMTPVSQTAQFNVLCTDLAFNTLVTPSVTSLTQGDGFTISFTLKNIGTINATNIIISLYVENSTSPF